MKFAVVKCVTEGCPNPAREQNIAVAIPIGEGMHQDLGPIKCDGCGMEVHTA